MMKERAKIRGEKRERKKAEKTCIFNTSPFTKTQSVKQFLAIPMTVTPDARTKVPAGNLQ
jgi:hypothetical protein